MNDHSTRMPPDPDKETMERLETAVRQTAREFPYPPTPDIARVVRARMKAHPRRGWTRGLRLAAATLLALAVITLVVPQTRAFVLEVLRVGVVRIFFGEPTPASTLAPSPPPSNFIPSALDLPGATTLADAERQLGSPILLPAYPPDLGAPDHVFAQTIGEGVVVTLVWLEAEPPAHVSLLLQVLNARAVASKYFPWEARNEQQVVVNGRRAYWLTDVHRLYFFDTKGETSRLVDKDVLLWDIAPLTYRLETELPLEEAIRVAESLE